MSHCMVDGSDMVLHNGLVVGSAVVGDTVGGVVDCGNVGCMVSHWGNSCVVSHGGHTVWSGGLVMDERGDGCLVDWSLVVSSCALMTIHRCTYMVGGLGTVD